VTRCDGCLDNRQCWVCLGYGVIEYERGKHRTCRRCYGSGKCAECQPVTVQDLGHPPELTP